MDNKSIKQQFSRVNQNSRNINLKAGFSNNSNGSQCAHTARAASRKPIEVLNIGQRKSSMQQ